MKNIYLFIIILFTTNLNAQSIIQDEHKIHYSNGQLKEYCDYDSNEQLTGIWKSYYKNGKLKETGKYNKDKKEGKWKTFHKNGVLFETRNYDEKGNLVGKIYRYHDSGKKARVGKVMLGGVYKWIEDYDVGGRLINEKNTSFKWKTYTEDGAVYKSGEYLNGKENGEWTWYYENGDVDFVFTMKNDLKIGLKSYYKNGNNKEISIYKNDKIIEEKAFFENNGQLKYIKTYKDGHRNGKWIWYYKNGKIDEIRIYENGSKTGVCKKFYPNGQLAKKEEYDLGKETGVWELYENNGVLLQKAFWKKNIINNYDVNGKVISTDKIY